MISDDLALGLQLQKYFFSFVLFQSFLIVFLFLEDIVRLPNALYRYVTNQGSEGWIPERRKFISKLALGLAAVPFSALLYGMVRGKYNYKVLKYSLASLLLLVPNPL